MENNVSNNINKKIRKAVRSYLIKDNKILVIKYTLGSNKDYIDIPGGKIEDGETPEETSIREFKEETGIVIKKQEYKGNFITEYPDRIYDMETFIVTEFEGEIQNFEENTSMWIDLNQIDLIKKKLPNFEIIKYLNKDKINLFITVDENHNIIEVNEK